MLIQSSWNRSTTDDDDDVDIVDAFAAGESTDDSTNAFKDYQFGESAAASAAVERL